MNEVVTNESIKQLTAEHIDVLTRENRTQRLLIEELVFAIEDLRICDVCKESQGNDLNICKDCTWFVAKTKALLLFEPENQWLVDNQIV